MYSVRTMTMKCSDIFLTELKQLFLKLSGEEDSTKEYIGVCFLIVEFGILTNTTRRSTVKAVDNSHVLVLTNSLYEKMLSEDAYLGLVLSRICMVSGEAKTSAYVTVARVFKLYLDIDFSATSLFLY